MVTIERSTEQINQVVSALKERIGDKVLGVEQPTPHRLYVTVAPEAVVAAANALFNGLGARYLISAGVDKRPLNGGFEVLHFFAFDQANVRCALVIPLKGDPPRIPSITPLIPGAGWAEREFKDLLGIIPEGHPDPRPLVLPDGFPEGLYPLRKDYPYDYKPPLDRSKTFPFKEPPEGTTVVTIGPFFPVLEEPSQWRVFLDGEVVVGCDYRGFYNHRAIEKLGDSALTYNQIPMLAERICGICGCVHSTSYCQAVEEAAGIEVPLRAKVIRTLILELERVHSHLLWLGLACHILGFDYVFMQSWRIREPVMWLAEYLTGNRKHFAINLVGGVRRDIVKEQHPRILEVMDKVERETKELADTLLNDMPLLARLKGTGIFTPEEVRLTGAVGPTARGSGVPIDVRKDHPYAAYDLVEFDVVTHDGCDNLARTLVRVGEIFESIKIIRQCVKLLQELPEGDLMAELPEEIPPYRHGMHAVEAPRGEVFHYVLTGENNRPYRWRVRAPSYQNIQAVPVMFKPGTTIADVPITLGSVDPCFSCTERMEIVDVKSGEMKVLTEQELYQLSRQKTKELREKNTQ
jgi:Ni,Fe-hydrogenase III large subunit/Ni,Fe-hydrogenase III component G